MKKLIKYNFIVCSLVLCYGCNWSDGTEELPGNYFLRREGKDLNDILSHGKSNNQIQANVLRFNYDDDFIIAEQKPKAKDDPLYEKVYDYKEGRNKIYYWIIVINKDLLLGPLNKSEFDKEKTKYNIPKDLVLKAID